MLCTGPTRRQADLQCPKHKLQNYHAVLCTGHKEIQLTCSGAGKHYGSDRLCFAQGQQGGKANLSCLLSAHYRSFMPCSAQGIKEPKLTSCVVRNTMTVTGCVLHRGNKAAKCSKADLKLLASGSAGGAQAGLLLGGGRARGRGGLLHPGLGLPQHLQHQSPTSIPNTINPQHQHPQLLDSTAFDVGLQHQTATSIPTILLCMPCL